ncbi:MAG: PAS domain S-box protein [Legionella sp.]|nr:PAS domain S-box protein [Legionella sp.]
MFFKNILMSLSRQSINWLISGAFLFLLVQLVLHVYVESMIENVKENQQRASFLASELRQNLDKTTQSKQKSFALYNSFLNESHYPNDVSERFIEAKDHFQKLVNYELENLNSFKPNTVKPILNHENIDTKLEVTHYFSLFKKANKSIDALQSTVNKHQVVKVRQLGIVATLLLILLTLNLFALVIVIWRINFSIRNKLGASLDDIHKLISKIGDWKSETIHHENPKIGGSIFSELLFLQEKLSRYEDEIVLLNRSMRETSALLNKAEQLALLGSWSLDLFSGKLLWSDQVFRIFEVDQSCFAPSYQEFLNLIHPLDRDDVTNSFTSSLQTKTPYDITHRLLTLDGRLKWVRWRGLSDYDANGSPIRSSGSVQDVTELKNAEDQIRIAAVAFELKEGIVITDAEGTILRVNNTFSQITGYSAELAVGKKMNFLKSDFHDDNFYQEMWLVILRDGHWQGEIWNRVQTGEVRLHAVVISAVKSNQNVISYYVGTYVDITEKQYAENQLRIAAITFETHEAIMITDVGTNIIRVNRAFEKLTGYQEHEVIGKNPRLLNSGRHDQVFYDHMWKNLNDLGTWTGDVWDKRKDGSIYPKQLTITAVKNAKGDTSNYVGVFMDISERKQAETLLQQSERYLANILDSLDEVVWTATAPDYQLRHVNAATMKIYGVSPDEFKSDPDLWIKFVHPEDRAEALKVVQQTLISGKANVEYRILQSNGQERWLSDRRTLVYDQDGEVAELLGVFHDMTERKLVERTISEQQNSLVKMLQTSPIAVRIATLHERKVLFANNRYLKMINCDLNQVMAIDPMSYYADPQDSEYVLNQLKEGLSVSDKLIKLLIPDVGPIWVMASYLQIDYGGELAILGWFYDVTALREAQEGQQLSDRQLKRSLDELKYQKFALDKHAIVAITDVQGRITYANEKFCEISGYSQNELIGQDHAILNSGYHPKGFFKKMYQIVSRGKAWHSEVCNRAKDGHLYWVDTTIAPFIGENGKPESYISIRTDITQGKMAEEKSTYLALYDSLTGLPNRRLLQDRLKQALTTSERTRKKGALLFLDLDHFKVLNDTLGHDIGDLLLKQVAERLNSVVREGDTVARLGGDEFVVILEDLSEEGVAAGSQAKAIGKKILSTLNKSYQLNTHNHLITPSIGITLFDGHVVAADDLLKQADIAMYQAKKTGRNAVSFFDPEMQSAIYERVEMESELRKALVNQQFHLYYQLQVDAKSSPIGVEALLRWIHPSLGIVSPSNFIPIAEESGLILDIGKWVLDSACAQLKLWEGDTFKNHLTMSINVSVKQLRQKNFISLVQTCLKKHAINPTRLKLELTESMLLDRIDDTIDTMNILKNIGVRCSLDDFGTGYSSLQYLKRLPLYQLKIDRSFVRDIAVDSNDQAIIRTIIAMAHTLNLNVIAEGVETILQKNLLEVNGCLHYQGYLFGKPIPIDELTALLNSYSDDVGKHGT